MIIQDLLPTDSTAQCDGGQCQFSQVFYYINTVGTKYPVYCLGYISRDNLPITMRANKCTFEDGIATFTDNTADANFPCGYIAESVSYSYLNGSIQQNNANPPSFSDYYWYLGRFINQMYPEYVGMARGATVYATFIMYAPGTDNYDGTVYDTLGLVNAADLWSFLKYPDTTFTKTFGSTYGSFDFCARDFENNTDNYFETTTGYHVRVFITEINFGNMYRYYHGSTHDIALPFFANVSFKESIKYNSNIDVLSIIVTNTANPNQNQYDSGFAVYENGAINYTHFYGSGVMPSGATGTINVDGFIANHSVPWVYDGDILAHYRNGNIYFKCIRRPSEIMKQYSLFMRVLPEGGYNTGYSLGIYATDVTSSDEFLAQLKTGDIRDPDFKNGLRPWQYEDFQSDDFDPDDIPPYVPPGPGPSPRPEPEPPGDDEHGGDDITLPSIDGLGGSFGFTTQYALRGSQLEELGALLWSGFDSTNPNIDAYLQNFVYRVDLNTGSVNMSDIMDFFVSLKAYPLPLGNLVSVTAAGNDFYIGSGAEPLAFTSTLHTANTYLSEVDAGSVAIPFWFGDYRDYSTEITLYLPYCGTAELNAADVMGGTLTATYVVDLSTGSCTAYVMCDTYDGHTYPVAILPGQLGVDIPITASNAGRVGARLLGDRINVAENLLSVAKYGATGIGALMSGNVAGAIRSGISAFIDPAVQDQKLLAGMAERGAIAAPMLSGGRGLAGFKNPMTAYVQVRSPFYAVPDNFSDAVGDPAAMYVQIGSCSGFCRFVNVDVTGVTTDAGDQSEIRRALENGVFV